MQFTPRQHGLEHVAGVHRTLGRARPDDGVQLVNKEDDLAGGIGHLFEHRLQPFLELAPVLGTGDQRAHVERDDALVLQPLGHVAAHNALGQPLGDGRFSHTGITHQYRVVLGAAAEDLHHAPDLVVPPDDRVQFSLPGQRGQVAPVLLEGLVGGLGVLVGDPMATTNGGQRPQDSILGDTVGCQEAGCLATVHAGKRQQQMLGAGVVVTHAGSDLLRLVQYARQFTREAHLRRRPIHLGFALQFPLQRLRHLARIGLQLLDDLRHDAIGLAQEHQQQMGRLDLAVAVLPRQRLSAQYRLLCLLRKFV